MTALSYVNIMAAKFNDMKPVDLEQKQKKYCDRITKRSILYSTHFGSLGDKLPELLIKEYNLDHHALDLYVQAAHGSKPKVEDQSPPLEESKSVMIDTKPKSA